MERKTNFLPQLGGPIIHKVTEATTVNIGQNCCPKVAQLTQYKHIKMF